MNRVFTLVFTLMVAASAMAQHGAMVFVGKSNFHISMNGATMGNTDIESDTIVYSGADFTLPSMKYGDMVIPSFTIKGTQFTGGYAGVMWADQTWTSTVTTAEGDKTFTGTSLVGSFTHDGGIYKLSVALNFKYGSMPFPISYSIEGYYVKPTEQNVSVTVGGSFGPYTNDKVTYDARLYTEGGEKKLDIAMHEYQLTGTVMGDLTIGAYTVTGLTYDEAKQGYYRDYTNSDVKMHLTAMNGGNKTIDGDYSFSKLGNLLVKMDGTSIAYAVNNFQPGNMPFPIESAFGKELNTAVDAIAADEEAMPVRKMIENGRIVILKNGAKYNVSGTAVK